ncbi:DUF4249 domain-containing protein [Robiginitalea sp. SC105]|uniref:DUF4249 domain-containing protein n=1 Tax=Robiginitalea sp. SC105 TaxID=2762332 RepID=UPI00163ABF91|nr:DUF4249 domain-containing protein [Robiginitalea sp. SC105]MBC2840442.1 DUF4249 domain-containing protein [Robiginitalea sp. SC105]
MRSLFNSRPLSVRFLLVACLLTALGCVEEIEIETDRESIDQARNALVVEATLTDEDRTQEVVLSRAADFENDSIVGFDEEDPDTYLVPDLDPENRPILYETGASVTVEDDRGVQFDFVEGEPGRYFSVNPFAAEAGRGYRLLITLRSGNRITSEFESVPGTASLEDLRAERATDPLRGPGIQFAVDGLATAGTEAYFRYTFEETFKVVAPLWSPEDFVLSNYDPCADPVEYDLEIVTRTTPNQVCYRTEESESIIQGTTVGLSSGELRNFPVHFIDRQQYKIAERYSILVRQHVEDLDAYLYYDRLRNFSQEGNVFSQIQPGFLQGNLQPQADAPLLVIGYFSVTSVSERRIFLDFEDFFPGEAAPPFVVPCVLRSSPVTHLTRCPLVPVMESGSGCPLSVIELLDLGGLITYYATYDESLQPGDPGYAICPGPYSYAPRVCGDCTVLGTNQVPDFWIE